jgi:thioredoxin reductase (NADPH)
MQHGFVDNEEVDVLSVGADPAGVAAGVFAAAEGLSALVVEDIAIGGQAAMFPSRIAARVRLSVRGDTLATSMSSYLSPRREADPAITIEYGAQVGAVDGSEKLERVTIRTGNGTEKTVDSCAVFIMAGAVPNRAWLADLIQLDDKGFVLTGPAVEASSPFATSCPGGFAVGDVRAGSVIRVVSLVGEGSVVISKFWER